MLRSLRAGERYGSVGVVVGLSALALVGSVLLAALVWQVHAFDAFRNNLADICTSQRSATEQVRTAQRQWLLEHQEQEAVNRFIDADLREQRVDSDQRVIDAFDRALAVGMPRGCEAYR